MPFTFAHGDDDWRATGISDPRLRREVEARLKNEASRHGVPTDLPLVGHFVSGTQWVVVGRAAGEEAFRGDILTTERRSELDSDPYEALIHSGLDWLEAYRPRASAPAPPTTRQQAEDAEYLGLAWAWWLRLDNDARQQDYWSIVPDGRTTHWPHARFAVTVEHRNDLERQLPEDDHEDPWPDRLMALEGQVSSVLRSAELLVARSKDHVSKAEYSEGLAKLQRTLSEHALQLKPPTDDILDLQVQLGDVGRQLRENQATLDELGTITRALEQHSAKMRRRRTPWILAVAFLSGLLGFAAGWIAREAVETDERLRGLLRRFNVLDQPITDVESQFTARPAPQATIDQELQPIRVKLRTLEQQLTQATRQAGQAAQAVTRSEPKDGSEGDEQEDKDERENGETARNAGAR